MVTGVSTASLFLRKSTEDVFPLFQQLGIQHAEVFLTTFSEYGEAFARKLLQTKGNIDVHSVHILNTQFEPQLFNGQLRTREDAHQWLETVLCGAQLLGAKYYTFHGLARVKSASRSGKNDNFAAWVPHFQQIISACEKHGVTLCLENVEWSTYNRPGVFTYLAQRLPSLGGVLDIKQARISGHPYEAYLNEMGSRLKTVHLSDIDENGKMCLPGMGTFDFETLIKRLRDYGFNGALLMEAYADDYNCETELKTACDYINELIYKYGCHHFKNS